MNEIDENDKDKSAVYQLQSEKNGVVKDTDKNKAVAKADAVNTGETAQTIEVLKEQHKTPASVFDAVKARYDWAEGLEMTSAEYQAQLENWLGEPIGRKV